MKRKLVWAVVVAVLTGLLVTHRSELAAVGHALRAARRDWLLAAVAAELVYLVLYSAIYRASFAAVGVRLPLRRLVLLLLSSLSLNVAAAGSGAALFVADASRRGQSGTRAAVGSVLVKIADLTTFVPLVLYSLFHLSRRRELHPFEIGISLGLLAVIGAFVALLGLALWHPDRLTGVFGWVGRRVNGVLRRIGRPGLPAEWAAQTAHDYIDGVALMRTRPTRMSLAWLAAALAHLAGLAVVLALALALGEPLEVGLLTCGFSIAMLFWVVPLTPQGIGVVEGSMVLTYTGLGMPPTVATSLALAFRGLTFWLPMLLGWLLLPRLVGRRRRLRGTAEPPADPAPALDSNPPPT
ncbi:MAG: flippase-like domain-containing protein [Fimbriimonadaceae bacterium]|nr:flippase-like domain-containing protein [Fimbriimonadaceae bacterium]